MDRHADPDRWRRREHGFGPAAPLLISLVVLALSVARVATWALFRLFLPIFLTILSVPLFSRALRRAAWRCREVGVAGDRGLVHAIEAVRGRGLGREIEVEGEAVPDSEQTEDTEPHAGRSQQARPSATPRTRVRLDEDPEELLDDDEDDARRRQHR